MADPTLAEIMAALADQIRTAIASKVDGLQVEPQLLYNPTPPAIDIYPADPFQQPIAMGPANNELFFTVRARVNTPDIDGAQETLLEMMDPRSDASVALAIAGDRTLGGKAGDAVVSAGPSNYGIFTDPAGVGAWLGCTWTVRVTP